MADSRRQTKVARPSVPDALALPHVVEVIAMCLDNQKDFSSFLHAVPRSLWTPALSAFLDCATVMPSSVIANWPHIKLRDMDLPPLVLALLAATLPLRPRIEPRYVIRDAAPLALLVAAVGPALSTVALRYYRDRVVQGRGQAISDLLLQRCPRLCKVSIDVESYFENNAVELNGLLAVVAHPHVHDVSIDLECVTTPRLGHHLAAILSTAPTTKLRLACIDQMDHDGVIAFCDALQASTTLQELIVYDVHSLGGFHGRTLPLSLKTLDWDVRFIGAGNVATLTDFATAVGPTQLQHLHCNSFAQLATCPAAWPMLSQLQSLTISALDADRMEALIDGLSLVPALTSLDFGDCDLSSSAELLMETLATTCMHLGTLHVWGLNALTRCEVVAVLSGTLDLPRLTSLSMVILLSPMLYVLPELVAAGRHLRTLHLETIYGKPGSVDEGKCALCRALALLQNVPFVVEALPEDTDAFVVDALGPRADRGDRCRLSFSKGI